MNVTRLPITFLFFITVFILSNCDDNETITVLEWGDACSTDSVDFRMVDVGKVSLNVACQGEGPVIVLLHGFPEFWYGWKPVMDSLAEDYRLIVPDQRGYNLSDKPDSLAAYKGDLLAADIAGLIRKVSAEPILLVGHDWGGAIAWLIAHQYPELIKALVILNAPHPDIFKRELANNPDQQAASSYIDLIQNPNAEMTLSANNYGFMTLLMSGTLSASELEVYKQAWSQPGALTAMLAWYRASYDNGIVDIGDSVTIGVPTLVLWGMQDGAILPSNLNGLENYVTDLEIKQFPQCRSFYHA